VRESRSNRRRNRFASPRLSVSRPTEVYALDTVDGPLDIKFQCLACICLAHSLPQCLIVSQVTEVHGQPFDIPRIKEEPVHAIVDSLGDGSDLRCDDREAAGHPFEDGKGGRIRVGRGNQNIARRNNGRKVGLREHPAELDERLDPERMGLTFQLGPGCPITNEDQADRAVLVPHARDRFEKGRVIVYRLKMARTDDTKFSVESISPCTWPKQPRIDSQETRGQLRFRIPQLREQLQHVRTIDDNLVYGRSEGCVNGPEGDPGCPDRQVLKSGRLRNPGSVVDVRPMRREEERMPLDEHRGDSVRSCDVGMENVWPDVDELASDESRDGEGRPLPARDQESWMQGAEGLVGLSFQKERVCEREKVDFVPSGREPVVYACGGDPAVGEDGDAPGITSSRVHGPKRHKGR
jgi:hypothetical protein